MAAPVGGVEDSVRVEDRRRPRPPANDRTTTIRRLGRRSSVVSIVPPVSVGSVGSVVEG